MAVEIQFGKYSFIAYDLFVKHLAFYVGNAIDVGIEILPMKSMQQDCRLDPAITRGRCTTLPAKDGASLGSRLFWSVSCHDIHA